MPEQCYAVVLQTPIGKKYGTLTASVSGQRLFGWLELLEHREPFEGIIDSDGRCTFSGKLITLLRTIPFTATGKLTKAVVRLQLQGDRNVFELTGVCCANGGT
ncbi:MAG: hypothetical protein ACI39E_00525 [Acutalibacteraceae bacterium]